MLYYIILYGAILYCIILSCTILYYIILYCAILYYITLYCAILYCIILPPCTILYCIIIYCTILIVSYHIVSRCAIKEKTQWLHGVKLDHMSWDPNCITRKWRSSVMWLGSPWVWSGLMHHSNILNFFLCHCLITEIWCSIGDYFAYEFQSCDPGFVF